MGIQYQKTKSVSKQIVTKGERLQSVVLNTMRTISDIVGATLGPGGQPVLIERFEHDLPPTVTKDGVSVMRALGMENASAQCIMECARDAAVRTVSEAGDGTTTATVLAEAFVRRVSQYCARHPKESPQKVVRRLEKIFRTTLEPSIKAFASEVDSTTEIGQELLRCVATVSANGDEELADKVMECFGIVGDDGNVTINELSGPSGYLVTKIDGFPIGIGYEDCAMNFYPKFINDIATQKTVMENPVFILYYGQINDIQTVVSLLMKIGDAFEYHKRGQSDWDKFNVVLCATGFSNSVLGILGGNFGNPDSIKVYPLVAPKSPFFNGQLEFLRDVAAITGATLFDPINNPIDQGTLDDLGPGVAKFEATRFRSTIVGNAGEDFLIERVADLEALLVSPESELDRLYIEQRIAKLTGGIANLTVIGASNGELKEKRDRAEDAVCSVRGAIKHGYLPGGGWTLVRLIHGLHCSDSLGGDPVVEEVLIPSLREPIDRLLSNCGMDGEERDFIFQKIYDGITANQAGYVYDALEHRYGDAVALGILDATPAVLEALRNSISIASLLGTLGGTVVFKRDHELERSEAKDAADWVRTVNDNPANERA
jgi:chaperonin GroEL